MKRDPLVAAALVASYVMTVVFVWWLVGRIVIIAAGV